jgi:hypothetical protein
MVEKNVARHWNHPSETVKGFQVAARGHSCTPAGPDLLIGAP